MKFQQSLPLVVCALAVGVPAHAGIIYNITYTAAVQGNANYSQIQNAVNYVANEFSSTYSDNVTLNFLIDQNASGLGESLFSNAYFRGSYVAVKNALTLDAKSADDATAVASLPGAAPIGPNGNDWVLPSAEAKAVGLVAANSALSDGTFTFNSAVTYTYDPNNRQVAGAYDFIGVTEHEFSELMGRTSQLTNAGFGFLGFDLFRFTGNNTRNFGASGAGVYFSVNNGATNLKNYNGGSGDVQDWDSTVPTDPYNASTSTNQGHVISAVDLRTLDVAGWDLAAPEPSTFILGALSLGLIAAKLRKRTAA